MDARQFLAEFGHIADAPGGVARLRQLVLTLAMRGELVPQSLSDPPSEVLMQEVAAEKRALRNLHPTAPLKTLPEIGEDDAPYTLPPTWQWVRFGEIALHNSGKTLDSGRNRGELRDYITTSNLYWGRFELGNVRKMPIREEEIEKCTARKNDLLICEGGEAGRAAVWSFDHEVCFQNHIHRARLYAGINPHFAYRFFEKINATGEINQYRKGIGISNMSSKSLAMIPFPLAPLPEQVRIASRLSELMNLCDALEAKQMRCRSLQSALRQFTLQAVTVAASAHELQLACSRLQSNFESLFQAPEDVNALRDAVLNLAIRGLLLPVASIGAYSSEEELPVAAIGWSWKTLGESSRCITSGSRGWKEYMSPSGDVFIRSQDIKHDALAFESPAFVTLPESAEGKRTLVQAGDLLLTITGANVGKCALVPDLSCNAYVSQHVALIRLHDTSLAEFVHYWIINTFGGRKFLSRFTYGDKPGLNLSQVAAIPIPIPPELERTQILATLAKLRAMCDQFARQVHRKRHLAELFAGAAVASITGLTVDHEENKIVKVPETELIAPLRLDRAPDIEAQAPLATILAHNSGELAARDLWQRFGGEIDVFYAQLKTEVAHGWIQEPTIAEMREIPTEQETA